MALKAEIEHAGDLVNIKFSMSALEFVKLADSLKKQPPKPVAAVTQAPDITEKKAALRRLIEKFRDEHPDLHPRPMYLEFFRYWGEPSKNGKKIRYEGEQYFDMGKRLASFKGRTKPDELSKMWDEHNKQKAQNGTNQL